MQASTTLQAIATILNTNSVTVGVVAWTITALGILVLAFGGRSNL